VALISQYGLLYLMHDDEALSWQIEARHAARLGGQNSKQIRAIRINVDSTLPSIYSQTVHTHHTTYRTTQPVGSGKSYDFAKSSGFLYSVQPPRPIPSHFLTVRKPLPPLVPLPSSSNAIKYKRSHFPTNFTIHSIPHLRYRQSS
jgi:hypothetical protein